MIDKYFVILFLVALNVFCGGWSKCYAEKLPVASTQPEEIQEELVPDHEIKYEEKLSPNWKVNWDLARSLYRDKKYPEALVQYELLLAEKENIDEARWEYASILMFLGRWENAKGELEKLLAIEPENNRYQIAMAQVSLETGNVEYAVALYTQLLDRPISDPDKVMILEGLIKACELQQQKDKIPQLLAELVSLKPQDQALLLKQINLELELGNIDKASDLCAKLEQSRPNDITVLSLRAQIEEMLENNDQAAIYWQKVIGLDPVNTAAHDHLYAYYFHKENWAMSFKHLEQLVKMAPNDIVLLSRAADLNMRLGRIDRALEYYEFALAVDPLNTDVIEGKTRAHKILAKDLLALVENDDEKKLWQDIVKVAPDSVGVYREIANLLREQGNVVELTEVLRLLNKQAPGDQNIHDELASLLKQQGMVDELAALQTGGSSMTKHKEIIQ